MPGIGSSAYGTRPYGASTPAQATTYNDADIILSPSPGTESNIRVTAQGVGTVGAIAAGTATASLNTGVRYTSSATFNGKAVTVFTLGAKETVSSAPKGVSTAAVTTLVALDQRKTFGDIFLLPSDPLPGDITLEAPEGPDSLIATAAGAASCTLGLGARIQIAAASAGVGSMTSSQGYRHALRATTLGVGGISPNRMLVILATDKFVIYPNKGIVKSNDVLLANTRGPLPDSRANTSMVGGFFIGLDMIGGDAQVATPPPATGAMFAFCNGQSSATTSLSQKYGIRATSGGRATMTITASQKYAISSTSAGAGGAKDQFGTTGKWYLGSSTRMAATSSGVGGTRDQFGTAGKWYLGSSTRMTATSAGVGGSRDYRGVAGFWYLGSSTRMALTSNGVASYTKHYLASPQRLTSTSAGKATATAYLATRIYITATSAGRATTAIYLGSPFRVTSTSAGRATATAYLSSKVPLIWTAAGKANATVYLASPLRFISEATGKATVNAYLASAVYFAGTSPGRATVTLYVSSPQRITSTSAGRATVTNYLSSPVLLTTTFRGYGGGSNYLASRVYSSATSAGRGAAVAYVGSRVYQQIRANGVAGGTPYLSGTLLMANIRMRGVGHMNLGPALIYVLPMTGVGTMTAYLASPAQVRSTSNGVGNFNDGGILIAATMNGSAKGTQFDKPPLAFLVNAGCRSYTVGYRRGGEFAGSSGFGFSHDNVGVIAYMSSRMGFGNFDPNRCHIGSFGFDPTPSTMQGRSTFTFPYEPRSIANAGCLAYHGYLADYDFGPRPGPLHRDLPPHFHAPGYTGMAGVFMSQTGRAYMEARTRPEHYYGNMPDRWYLSSRVYQDIRAAGRASMFFRRLDEYDFNGVGGADITLGVDHRQLESAMNGVADWPNNYFPDRQKMRLRSNGIGGMQAYQIGTVHVDPGDVADMVGVGNFFIDPGLLKAQINGISTARLERNTEVYLSWGLGPFFHRPSIGSANAAPILIPMSSSGRAEMEIEINGVPVIKVRPKGVATVTNRGLQAVTKRMTSISRGGGYPWYDLTGPGDDAPIRHIPEREVVGTLPARILRHEGAELVPTPVEVVWMPQGVGRLRVRLRLDYMMVWNRFGDGRRFQEGTNRALGFPGAEGHLDIAGPRKLVSTSAGRGGSGLNDMTGFFANVVPTNGVATFLASLSRGPGMLDLYGDMLALNFSVEPGAFGQMWPRRFRLSGLPV